MLIKEFHKLPKETLSFDIAEDTIIFMRNDPTFYRKTYFPAITRLADTHRQGKNIDPNILLMPMVEKGCNEYVKKYNIGMGPEEAYNNNDRTNILQRIYSEELEQIRNGEYK